MRVTKAAVTPTCAICERTLLMGERSLRFSPDGSAYVDVCPLCQEIALEHGWVKEGAPTTPVLAPDRRRLALPAAARVVVLDVPTGRTAEVDVPDPTLRTAGWTADGRTVVVRARAGGWAVDPETRTVERVGDARAPGWGELAWVGGATVVRRLADDGRVSAVEAVGGPPVLPFGPSASTPRGWVAAAAFLPGRYQGELGLSQGVVAVGPGGPLRALALRAPVGSSALRFRVLGWVEPATALLESRSLVDEDGGPVLRVLAWDVAGERLWQVGTVDGVGGSGGWFRGQWGL